MRNAILNYPEASRQNDLKLVILSHPIKNLLIFTKIEFNFSISLI